MKEIDPGNIQAAQGLHRIREHIDDEKDAALNISNKSPKAEESKRTEPRKTETTTHIKQNTPSTTATTSSQSQSADLASIEKIKDEGNKQFKNGNFPGARDQFFQGINEVESQHYTKLQSHDADVIRIYSQLLTNSALCCLNLK